MSAFKKKKKKSTALTFSPLKLSYEFALFLLADVSLNREDGCFHSLFILGSWQVHISVSKLTASGEEYISGDVEMQIQRGSMRGQKKVTFKVSSTFSLLYEL